MYDVISAESPFVFLRVDSLKRDHMVWKQKYVIIVNGGNFQLPCKQTLEVQN